MNETWILIWAGLAGAALGALFFGGLWWTIHMWAGMPLLCGATGVFASYLIFPPAIPTEESA